MKVAKDKRWRDALQQEIQELEDNGTWESFFLLQDKKALGYKWVDKVKYNSNGSVEHYMSQLLIF